MVSPALPVPLRAFAGNGSRRVIRDAVEAIIRVVAVTLVLAAAGSWPSPDTNESHYLCEARQVWNPSWCSGDFFLGSPEAHPFFYRLLGAPAAWLSLPEAAWLGRIAGWMTLAVGLCTVCAALMPSIPSGRGVHATGNRRPWVHLTSAVLLAALYSLAVRHTTASGEWVVGGCEGKVFAWGLVLVGAGLIAGGKLPAACLAFGCATTMHVLVGGWAMVAWIGTLTWDRLTGAGLFRPDRRWPTILSYAAGALLGLSVIVPAMELSRGVSAADAAKATRIYVVDRLPHHLLVRTFADGMVSRHVLTVALAFTLAGMLITRSSRTTPASRGREPHSLSTAQGDALRRLTIFIAMAVGLAVIGCGISLLEPFAAGITYGLLRYYWFRLSDGLVPLLLACTTMLFVRELPPQPQSADGTSDKSCRLSFAIGWLPTLLVVMLVAVDIAHESRHWPLPGRWIPSRADRHVEAAEWEEACGWIAANTPQDAVFLTPRGSASFQWRCGRAEVVSWKHVPQSLAGILEWQRRIDDCFGRRDGGRLVTSTADFGPERLLAVATRYGAGWIIVPRGASNAAGCEPPPPPGTLAHENAAYAIYELPRIGTVDDEKGDSETP